MGFLKKIFGRREEKQLKEYWRHQAINWWQTTPRRNAICDKCNDLMKKEEGFYSPHIFGSQLFCEECADSRAEMVVKNPTFGEDPDALSEFRAAQQHRIEVVKKPYKNIGPHPANEAKFPDKIEIKKDGRLGFFAWLFGIQRRKVWYILPQEKRSSGPYSLKELKEKYSGTSLKAGLRIRKGKKGQWVSWVNAIETYPILAYTNIAISNKKQNKLNVRHALHSSEETTRRNNERQKINEIEDEKKEWFLQTKRKKRKGPYTLKELKTVCKGFTAEDGIRIRKGKSGQWVAWMNAAELYPMLPKPRFRVKPSSSISVPEAKILFGRSTSGVSLVATYESRKHGISFEYPKHWKIQAEDGMEGFHTLIVRMGEEQASQGMSVSAVSVVIMAPVSRTESGIDRYLKNSKNQFADKFSGFEPHLYKQTEFLYHDAAWMEHSYDGANGRIREAVLTVFMDQRHFSLPLQFIFESPQPKFRQGVNTFKQLLNIVKVDKGGPKSNVDIKYIGAKEQNQAAQTQSSSAARRWFKEPSQRNGPLTPSDFNLFEAPSYNLKKWAEAVSSEPWRVHCSVVKIENLGTTTRTLFDILEQRYNLTSSEAVDIFNNYLGAACPECFGGLTGELLQTIETSKNAAGAVLLAGDPGLQRILDGTCASCSSKKYYVVWHGDKKYS